MPVPPLLLISFLATPTTEIKQLPKAFAKHLVTLTILQVLVRSKKLSGQIAQVIEYLLEKKYVNIVKTTYFNEIFKLQRCIRALLDATDCDHLICHCYDNLYPGIQRANRTILDANQMLARACVLQMTLERVEPE